MAEKKSDAASGKKIRKTVKSKATKAEKKVKKSAKKKEKRTTEGIKVNIYSLEGMVKGSVVLPPVFNTEFRPDLIRRAVTAYRANRRQPYGPSATSGMGHSVSTWGKGRGVARVQRIHDERRGAQSPGTVGGRRAHPPKTEKDHSKKVNKKEKLLAKHSALSAVKDKNMVSGRGHRYNGELSLPVIVEKGFEDIDNTKEAAEVLTKIGVFDDVVRAKEGKKIRSGRGKMRGRKYRVPKSVLCIVENSEKVDKGLRNLPGVDVVTTSGLNTEHLAPGGDPARLTIITENALENIGKWSL